MALNGIAIARPLRQRRFQGIESLQRRLVLIGPEGQRLWHIGKLSQRGVAVRGQRSGVTALRPILGPLSLVCYSCDQYFGLVCDLSKRLPMQCAVRSPILIAGHLDQRIPAAGW